jgi:hypothetical protein
MVPGRTKTCPYCGYLFRFSGDDGRRVQRELDKQERNPKNSNGRFASIFSLEKAVAKHRTAIRVVPKDTGGWEVTQRKRTLSSHRKKSAPVRSGRS